jgi:hypothetical protein
MQALVRHLLQQLQPVVTSERAKTPRIALM